MTNSCCGGDDKLPAADAGQPAQPSCCSGDSGDCPDSQSPGVWFDGMIGHCLEHARAARREGRPVIGILCEFTPRELIMAAGGVPVCLCGGSNATIPAAETQLPSNLCPLIKSTFGYHIEKNNPFLEMADLIVAETTCDGKKKMYELLSESRPVYVLELPQKVDDQEAFAHWLAELRKFKLHLEDQFDVTITDQQLRDACTTMNRERSLRRELALSMASDHPPMTGSELLKFKSSISGLEEDFQQYERAIQQMREPRCDADSAGSAGSAAPVRVLMTGVPLVHGAERVLQIMEENGGLVVAMENCTGLKPLLEDVDATVSDPMVAIAQKYFHLPCSVMTHNDRRLEALRQLTELYRPDCIVDLIWQACLTYDVESYKVKRFAEEELGLPYLRIETDYSPSDSARISVRVEALFETISSA